MGCAAFLRTVLGLVMLLTAECCLFPLILFGTTTFGFFLGLVVRSPEVDPCYEPLEMAKHLQITEETAPPFRLDHLSCWEGVDHLPSPIRVGTLQLSKHKLVPFKLASTLMSH